jgi:hypothetical protein
MPELIRLFDDPRREDLVADAMTWYDEFGHELYTALHLAGKLRYAPMTDTERIQHMHDWHRRMAAFESRCKG